MGGYNSADFLRDNPDAESRGELIDRLWPVLVYASWIIGDPMLPWPEAPKEPPRWRLFKHAEWRREMTLWECKNYGPWNVSPNNEITASHLVGMDSAIERVETFLAPHQELVRDGD